ncbi:hypothetical protein ONE63_011363 [Megalurothrips usitatus]|uniref:Uncharacterized protein n=1 Tax=Megalurothrips usitatus TaxID=439358 RepID=A0AAV7X322_9NEOP|nr:hypothetical protein ONE63_011363 [Megalurothrips usitatus]
MADGSKAEEFGHQYKAIKNVCPSHLTVLAAKVALNSGREHVNKYGQVRRARFVKSACPPACRRCETPRLSCSDRMKIFETFWSLSNHEDQWMYIFARVRQTVPQKRGAGTNSESKGKCSRVYHFLVNGVERRVCKTMFKNTLCICDSWIDSAMVHLGVGKKIPDMRGKHRQKQDRLTGNSRYRKAVI